MKIIHPDVASPIIDGTHNCYEWIIESPKLFSKYIQELSNQIDGQEGNFILLDNEKELDISKYAEIIIDPLSIDLNNRKIINKLYTELSQMAYEEENYLHTQEILSAIQEYFICLEQNSEYLLCTDSETDISAIFKFLNVRFENVADNLCEKINQYVKIVAELLRKKIIVFVNLCSYLSDVQLCELIKNIAYYEITVLLIESHQSYPSIPDKKCVIIDKDGCEIC